MIPLQTKNSMKRLGILAFVASCLLPGPLNACPGCRADGNDSAASRPEASPDGIGKFHMGREISGHERCQKGQA
jgi:hypothetical protein